MLDNITGFDEQHQEYNILYDSKDIWYRYFIIKGITTLIQRYIYCPLSITFYSMDLGKCA